MDDDYQSRAGIDTGQLSVRALTLLWKEFSEIQAATWLVQDANAIERFKKWVASGDDKDAWS